MKKVALYFVAIIFFITACYKWDQIEENQANGEATSISNMVINSDFNWKTIKNIAVSLKSNSSNIVYIKSIEGNVYHKAFLSSTENYVTKISLPTYVSEVILEQSGTIITFSITEDKINYTFN